MSAAGNQVINDPEVASRNYLKKDIPAFRPGDTVRVHAIIAEGGKERIQVFEGVVIRRSKGEKPGATFTVRKVSYNIGVERTFLLHSPRVAEIEVVAQGHVRRSRLYYLRPLRGKAARIKKRVGNRELPGVVDENFQNEIVPELSAAAEAQLKEEAAAAEE